jgi:hypothetical protein
VGWGSVGILRPEMGVRMGWSWAGLGGRWRGGLGGGVRNLRWRARVEDVRSFFFDGNSAKLFSAGWEGAE